MREKIGFSLLIVLSIVGFACLSMAIKFTIEFGRLPMGAEAVNWALGLS